mgnify:CR=1 FL=1
MSSPLPDKAADTTAEDPWPVRLLSAKIADYVDKMSVTWVEGQVVQLTRRPGARTAWLFGNEAQGLDEAELALAERRVAVPLYGAAESLNVGTAATVCLYASAMASPTTRD